MDADFIKDGSITHAILDNAIEGILIAEIESKKFRYANNAIEMMLGYSAEELLTLTVYDIHPREHVSEIIKMFEAQARGELKLIRHIPCLRKNGAVFWADINTSKVSVKGTICNVGFFSDITERKNAELKIDTSERLLKSAFDAVPDLLMVVDRSFKIIYTNSKGHDLIVQPDPQKAKTCYGRFKLLDSPCTECTALPVFETGAIVEREMVNPADGSTREVRAYPIKDQSGNVEYVIEHVRDITERKRVEADTLKLEQQIQQNQRLESLGILAGGIAHDFNNLLGGIYGYIDIAHTLTKEPRVKQYLETTLHTMNRARSLTQQLLTFSKGGAPECKTAPLTMFLHDAVGFALSGSNISCTYTIAENLWACHYDANQMGQVIDNIIINAQQSMPTGGSILLHAGNVDIETDTHPSLSAGGYVKISITDCGVGIPKEIIGRVFDPFFTTKQTGSGLGLATSYSVVKKHGGCIEVESEPGKGSTFHIFLPASEHMVSEPDTIQQVSPECAGFILVMDDEPVMRDSIADMLQHHGYRVVLSENGHEALQLFDESLNNGTPFAAVILDLTVPGGVGGKEMITEIRKKNAKIPVFVSSGYSEDPIIHNPEIYGFTDSIKKPFTRKNLIDMLSKYIK